MEQVFEILKWPRARKRKRWKEIYNQWHEIFAVVRRIGEVVDEFLSVQMFIQESPELPLKPFEPHKEGANQGLVTW